MKPRVLSALLVSAIAILCGRVDVACGQTQGEKNTNASAVATINGNRVITDKELDDVIGSQVFALQERLFNLRKNALDNLITKIVLEEEARARKVTVEELRNQLTPARVEIKQSQVDDAYAENAGALGNMPEDEAKQRIRLDLESRERLERYRNVLAEMKTKARVVISLAEPAPPTLKVSDQGPSRGGSTNAAVTIIEFSDFQCPYCKQAATTVRQVLEGYGDKVRLVFKHLPLPIHPEAYKAAQASVCAADQGKFWEYHDRLFGSGNLSRDALISLAAEIGLGAREFIECLDSESSRATVARDVKESREADIQATPTFLINGKMLKGSRGIEDFKRMIDQEIDRKQKNPARTAQ